MSKTIIKRGSVRKADPVDNGTHEVETDEADNPVTSETQKDVEPLKHSAQVICALMRHKNDEDEYLKGELEAMDHPEMKAGIEDYQAHREEGMKKLKALMEEHHPDVDVDKALAGEEPGEEGLEGEEGFTQDKDEPPEDEDDDEDVDDLVEEYSRPKGKGLKRKSVKKDMATSPDMDADVIKDASDFMCDLADDDQINKVHKAALKYHSKALDEFHKGFTNDADTVDDSGTGHNSAGEGNSIEHLDKSVEDMEDDSSDGEHDKKKKLRRKDNSYPQKPSQTATDGRLAATDDEDLEEDVGKSVEDMGNDSVDGEHDKDMMDDGEEMEVDDDDVETKSEDDEEQEEKGNKKVAPKSLENKVDRFLRTLYRATGVKN